MQTMMKKSEALYKIKFFSALEHIIASIVRRYCIFLVFFQYEYEWSKVTSNEAIQGKAEDYTALLASF